MRTVEHAYVNHTRVLLNQRYILKNKKQGKCHRPIFFLQTRKQSALLKKTIRKKVDHPRNRCIEKVPRHPSALVWGICGTLLAAFLYCTRSLLEATARHAMTFTLYVAYYSWVRSLKVLRGMHIAQAPGFDYFFLKDPLPVSYIYRTVPAKNFGGILWTSSRPMALVPAEPDDGCLAFENQPAVDGQVAMVQRGGCSFIEKAYYAERGCSAAPVPPALGPREQRGSLTHRAHPFSAGAAAVVVYDSSEENDRRWIDMVADVDSTREVRIPVRYISHRDMFSNRVKSVPFH